jgi:PKD repeat protein
VIIGRPMLKLRTLSLGLAATACLAAGAQSADAATFCVNSPTGCTGTPELTITGALTDAAASSGRDTIEIAGSNTYDESGLTDANGNPVDIVGVGAAPVITTANPEPVMMSILDSSSTISNVAFQFASGSTGIGLSFAGASATGIAVTGNAAGDATGIYLTSTDSTVSHASVTLPTSQSEQTTAVSMFADGEQVTDSTLAASIGVLINSGTDMTVSRTEIVAPDGVRAGNGAADTVEDSLLLVEGPAPGTVDGIQSNTAGGTVTVRGDTILAEVSGAIGIAASQGLPTTSTNAIEVRDSIVRGFAEDLEDYGAGAALSTDYDDYTTISSDSGATPIAAGAHDVNVDPDFVDAAAGDYHLAAASPLVDKGDPAPLTPDESTTDFYGADRLVAGHGGCTFVRDIGAAEFQALTPTASASAPSTATAGTPITFDGSKSCGLGSLSPITAYGWAFGDGTSATGATVRHAFSAPGKHTATLTVSTAAGHSAVATIIVEVSAKPVTAPRLTALSISPHAFATNARRHHKPGTTVSYKLSEAASVKLVLERVSAGRRGAHHKCVAPNKRHDKSAKCTRDTAIRGSLTGTGHAGRDSFHFTGAIGGRKLAPGSYLLIATASVGGHAGKPASVGFQVLS